MGPLQKVGEPINNQTITGRTPKWDTTRFRHWKNRAEWAKANPNDPNNWYGTENIKRMEKGLAPRMFDPDTGNMETIELHHIPPQREGGLFDFIEVTPSEHAKLDPYRKLDK